MRWWLPWLPHILQNILKKIAAGSTSDALKSKVSFIKSVQKSLSTRQFSDIAALCCVETAKVCSLVDPKETTVYRYYVTAIQAQLQVGVHGGGTHGDRGTWGASTCMCMHTLSLSHTHTHTHTVPCLIVSSWPALLTGCSFQSKRIVHSQLCQHCSWCAILQ